MKKRILLIITLVFVLTGCTANYELTYKKGKFSEKITIYEVKDVSNHEELPSITRIDEKSEQIKIDGDEHYTIEHSTDDSNNVLTLTYKYNNISFDKSPVFNECFTEKSFVEGKNSIYIKLGGKVDCEYLGDATFTFKTDKGVINTNATKEKNGTYTWDEFPEDGIIIEISKEKLNKDANIIPPVVRIIIMLLLLGIGIYVLKRFNGVTE